MGEWWATLNSGIPWTLNGLGPKCGEIGSIENKGKFWDPSRTFFGVIFPDREQLKWPWHPSRTILRTRAESRLSLRLRTDHGEADGTGIQPMIIGRLRGTLTIT
jgi:hypothetical protein